MRVEGYAITQCARAAALVGMLVGIAACAGIERARLSSPPTGPMWALFTDFELVLGPRALIYTRSRVSCEKERLQRNEKPCVQVLVGEGTDYFALGLPPEFDASLPDGAIGSTDRDRCGRFRSLHMLRYSLVGECEPIGVKRAP
jgi:hypothetical protein